jgi:hypothetical protein
MVHGLQDEREGSLQRETKHQSGGMLTTNSNTPGRQDDGISKENVNNWAEWTP